MPSQTLTVLVLDITKARTKDEELVALLRERSFQVKTMRDPRRGASSLRKGETQIVVLLIGRRCKHPPAEVLTRLRDANADVPTIVLSPSPQLDEAVMSLREHAFDYLDRRQLEESLPAALERAIAEKGYSRSPEETLLEQLGVRLRAARLEQQLTLRQLASRTGVSLSLLSQIELNHTNPSITTLFRVTRALGLPLERLFSRF